MNHIDWKALLETNYKSCVLFFFYIQKDITNMPESPKVDYSVFKYILEKCFPCGVKTDDLFSFFDEYDILLGSYPKYYENNLYFVAFAKSIHSMKIRNDLPNRNLANEKAVEYGFELLNEKLKLIDMN